MFQSLWNRAMSFDTLLVMVLSGYLFQSLWNRAMSFDKERYKQKAVRILFQSLWNRAMSFDISYNEKLIALESFNPFGTGQCLSTRFCWKL